MEQAIKYSATIYTKALNPYRLRAFLITVKICFGFIKRVIRC